MSAEAQATADLAYAAVRCALSVSDANIRRLRSQSRQTVNVGVYFADFLALVDAVEALYPGLLAENRRRIAEASK